MCKVNVTVRQLRLNPQVVSTIHLYGIGGVMFSAISIGDHFSVRLSFRTRFSDGLLLFVGASSEVGTAASQWLASSQVSG